MRALLVPVGDDCYAVPLDAAREVVVAPEVTTLPGAPPAVLGVFNRRGDVVPVLDTALLLGVASPGPPSHLLVVHGRHGPAALTMTAVGEAVELGEPVASSDGPATLGSFDVGRRLAVLVDLDALLVPERLVG